MLSLLEARWAALRVRRHGRYLALGTDPRPRFHDPYVPSVQRLVPAGQGWRWTL